MADIESININDNVISLKVKITKDEYNLLGTNTKDLLILPANSSSLRQRLTTGKLGNSNRIMVPKKFLEKNNIKILPKTVSAGIFEIDDGVFLVTMIKSKGHEIPSFEDEYGES